VDQDKKLPACTAAFTAKQGAYLKELRKNLSSQERLLPLPDSPDPTGSRAHNRRTSTSSRFGRSQEIPNQPLRIN